MTNYAPGIPEEGAIVGGIGAIAKAVRAAQAEEKLAAAVARSSKIIVTFGHGARHLQGSGIRASVVENLIVKHIRAGAA